MPHFSRSITHNFALAILAGSATLLSFGCGDDPDPGVCYTTGNFPTSQVDRNYAVGRCVDWVILMVENCVQVYGLSSNPTPTEIGAFCGSNVINKHVDSENGYPGYGGEDYYSYQLRTACDFIDNPSNPACSQYTAPTAKVPAKVSNNQTQAQKLVSALSAKAALGTVDMVFNGVSFSNTGSSADDGAGGAAGDGSAGAGGSAQ